MTNWQRLFAEAAWQFWCALGHRGAKALIVMRDIFNLRNPFRTRPNGTRFELMDGQIIEIPSSRDAIK